jgi:hypothetical protein
MAKKIRKTTISKKMPVNKILTGITGDIKMETVKSSEMKKGPAKPKTNGSKAARPKAGRLAVTDLRSDTLVMTRKKADKPVPSVAKTVKPEVSESKKIKVKVKSAGKSAVKPKATKKTEKITAVPDPKGPKKQYIKAGKSCKVTFRLPKEAAPAARMVTVVGDFNNWNVTETKMKKLKSGDFTTTLELSSNREYRFRYLIDANRWENDWFADKYIPNRYGDDDSVIVIEENGSV